MQCKRVDPYENHIKRFARNSAGPAVCVCVCLPGTHTSAHIICASDHRMVKFVCVCVFACMSTRRRHYALTSPQSTVHKSCSISNRLMGSMRSAVPAGRTRAGTHTPRTDARSWLKYVAVKMPLKRTSHRTIRIKRTSERERTHLAHTRFVYSVCECVGHRLRNRLNTRLIIKLWWS